MTRPEGHLWARATINLPGLKRGQEALVDPSVPYVLSCLRVGWVVPVDGEEWEDPGGAPEGGPRDTIAP